MIISEIIEVAKVARIRSCSPAPNSWEMMICTPIVIPISTDMARNMAGNAAPTAASALAPTNCPTMIESTALYICWNTLAKIIGMENKSTSFTGLPCVISFMGCSPNLFFRFFAALCFSPFQHKTPDPAARLFCQDEDLILFGPRAAPIGKHLLTAAGTGTGFPVLQLVI